MVSEVKEEVEVVLEVDGGKERNTRRERQGKGEDRSDENGMDEKGDKRKVIERERKGRERKERTGGTERE